MARHYTVREFFRQMPANLLRRYFCTRDLLADCVFDGHRLAREIDTADPSVPLPYLRELAPRPAALPDLAAIGA